MKFLALRNLNTQSRQRLVFAPSHANRFFGHSSQTHPIRCNDLILRQGLVTYAAEGRDASSCSCSVPAPRDIPDVVT